jgi:hypothetical protein
MRERDFRNGAPAALFLAGIVGGFALLFSAGAAAGRTPDNDRRAHAQKLAGVPSRVVGTTLGAKAEPSDPSPVCAPVGPTVWYRLRGAQGRTAVELHALGQLEAVVAVYRVDRSHHTGLSCSKTDSKGLAGLSFPANPKKIYLLLVGQRTDSIPGKFELSVLRPENAARPPGVPLPTEGTWASVNRLLDPDDAWATEMNSGTMYQINLVASSQRCLRLELYRSHTSAFRADEHIRDLGCDGFRTFTPGPDGGGTYTLRVIRDGHYRGNQNYRLQVRAATPDDGAPGVPLKSGDSVAGSLSPRTIDIRDVYRLSSTGRSGLTATLRDSPKSRFDLLLLSDTGEQIDCECDQTGPVTLRRVVDPGHYYLAVTSTQSSGNYRLSVLIREVTSTKFLVDGSTRIDVIPGLSVQATAPISTATGVPSATAIGGFVRMQFDRLDPFSGWQFVQLFPVKVGSDSVARLTWTPPSVGHWRAHAVFLGTPAAAPSETRYVTITVAEPLAEG